MLLKQVLMKKMPLRVGKVVCACKATKKGMKVRSQKNGEYRIQEKIQCDIIIFTEKTTYTIAFRKGGRCTARLRHPVPPLKLPGVLWFDGGRKRRKMIFMPTESSLMSSLRIQRTMIPVLMAKVILVNR